MSDGNVVVSAVIPTYNREKTIKRSIDSVLKQTYKDIEVIVVDDCSTDNTEDVVKSIKDPRVRYIPHESNKGVSCARNTGIKNAKGKFIAFLDSDDVWHEDKIEKQIKAFKESPPDHKVVYSGINVQVYNGGKRFYMPEKWVKPKEGDVSKTMLIGSFVSMDTIFVEKISFEEIGYFDERLHWAEDWEICIRLSKKYGFVYIDEALATSYASENSLTRNYEAYKSLELFFKKHEKNFRGNEDILSEHYFSLASVYFTLNDIEKARKSLKKAWSLHPFKLITFIRLLASLLGIWFFNNFRGFYRRIAYSPTE